MTPTDFTQFQADAMKATGALFTRSFEGFQQLTELNTRVARTAMEQSAEQMKNLMATQDPKALTELAADSTKAGETLTAYAKDVAAIASKTNADVMEMIDEQVVQGNKQIDSAIDAMAKNAPAGSEGAVALMKQSMSASRSAYEQASKASKQFAQTAQDSAATSKQKAK